MFYVFVFLRICCICICIYKTKKKNNVNESFGDWHNGLKLIVFFIQILFNK